MREGNRGWRGVGCQGVVGRKAGKVSRAPQLEGLSTRLLRALGTTRGG